MKPDANSEQDRLLDRQLANLAGTLRERGVAPERDLWPDIDRAIDEIEQRRPPRRNRQLTGWRIAALAASVLLLIGVGMIQTGTLPGGADAPRADRDATGEPAAVELAAQGDAGDEGGSLHTVDRALDELNAALALDPDNVSLSRLVLMVHRSRGDLIRDSARRLFDPGR